MGKKFLAILNSHGCKNVISNPTRVTQSTKSTIDLAIANNPPEVSNSGVLDLSIAHHKMIFVTYKMKIKNAGFLIKRVRNYRGLDEKSLQKGSTRCTVVGYVTIRRYRRCHLRLGTTFQRRIFCESDNV